MCLNILKHLNILKSVELEADCTGYNMGYICAKCRYKRRLETQGKDKKKLNEQQKLYYAKNREKHKARVKAYYEKNKKDIRKKQGEDC